MPTGFPLGIDGQRCGTIKQPVTQTVCITATPRQACSVQASCHPTDADTAQCQFASSGQISPCKSPRLSRSILHMALHIVCCHCTVPSEWNPAVSKCIPQHSHVTLHTYVQFIHLLSPAAQPKPVPHWANCMAIYSKLQGHQSLAYPVEAHQWAFCHYSMTRRQHRRNGRDECLVSFARTH